MAVARESELGEQVVEFISKGQITIPKRLRDEYKIELGQRATLIPISGALILVPHELKTPALMDQLMTTLGTDDMSLEEMIAQMREIRESSSYEA